MDLGFATKKQITSVSRSVLSNHKRLRPLTPSYPRKPKQIPSPSIPRTRSYATSNNAGGVKASSRRQVTVRNDDGRIQWSDLTVGEKAARTTQQTFNFGVIILGLGMTVRQHSITGYSLLILRRSAWSIFYIQKFSLQTAKLDTLTVPSTRLGPILARQNCSGPVRQFELSESQR